MPVITAGQSGASWGLNPETGVIAQTMGFKVARELKEEKGPQGDAALLAFFNAKGKYSGSGVIVGATGWAAAAPGVALVVANDPQTGSTYGITAANSIYIDDAEIPQANVEFKKVSFNGTKYAAIP
jgi:hypothetical protein